MFWAGLKPAPAMPERSGIVQRLPSEIIPLKGEVSNRGLFVMNDSVRLQLEDFSLDVEVGAMRARSKRIGGIAAFLGCARDFSGEHEVSEITFDAYHDMALAELSNLRNEAIVRFGLIDARIIHRVGTVRAGEDIVLIVAGAEHRAPAFEACRWLIDELKARTPIWKKEISPQGESWVTPHP